MRLPILLAAIVVVWVSAMYAAAAPALWHHPLYIGGDGYWRQRVAVAVRNDTDRPANGDPVEVRVGRGAGEANLVNALAQAVRVCDAGGVEMLYAITAPDGNSVTSGPIPNNSVLALPIECPAKKTATYYIYFDNPDAWEVPEFLEGTHGVRNGGVEAGTGDTPSGWIHDGPDDRHHASWVTENPHSGARSLKTVVAAGAQSTWIATRQGGLHIAGGAKYVMRAWVKAENVQGYAGWYIHVGNADNFMIISPMLSGGGGTYGWKEVSAEFTAPQEANRADLGTVLWGTGTAWFDDVTLECQDPPRLQATAAPPETANLRQVGAGAEWYDDNPRDDLGWKYRVPVRILNFADAATEDALVQVDFARVLFGFAGKLNRDSIRVTDGARVIPHYILDDTLLFEGKAPARSVRTYYAYLSLDKRIRPAAEMDYSGIVSGRGNLARNPSFEDGDSLPNEWPGSAEGERPAGTEMSLDMPGLFGKRCAALYIPHGAPKAWTGWRQRVPVAPGKTYLYAAWVKGEDLRDGSVQIYAHYLNAAGSLCQSMQYASAGAPIEGTKDWTLMSGFFEMPPDIATFELHLTMNATGTLRHDGVVLAEVLTGATGRLEHRAERPAPGVTAWPVNAIVKVFQDDAPPREIPAARISAARNESEPLQIAVRSPRALERVTVDVDAPTNARGDTLSEIEIEVVGYVPIDHRTAYFEEASPAWHRKYPKRAGSCDGWPGMWPDPLLPRNTFPLAADTTQPVWITVSVPRDAAAGDYAGAVRLSSGGAIVRRIPFTVHVWGFALPDETHVAAVYDLRVDRRWNVPGKTVQQAREDFYRFMAEHRLCPDTVQPNPIIKYENGQVTADFADFDRAAEYYFNTLKLPHTYTPWYFYCFGWGHPVGTMFGEKPYDGEYPYDKVDRSKLRPEFKRAYQACLKAYWDHMKAKGWADKCSLYVSDEPYDLPHIRDQMKALCDMIHEVDPAIPIYSSTWSLRPEWEGYIDVWGIGHYGIVAPDKMAQLRAAGDHLWYTTDGQMCTDTPYCAVERLLPHYCFNYGAEAYEFWGISWLTFDPYRFGWHAYIHQSGVPGSSTWVRYPNGDGYLAYPGATMGHDGPVSSVRLEQAREGVEDYEYLYLLQRLVAETKSAGKDVTAAERALRAASSLVDIPNAGGRYSTRILPDPDRLLRVREDIARAIEGLNGG